MVKIISDNESISYDGRPIVEAYEVGGVIDELELAITEKQTIELKLEEPSYETFELYQTKRGWFGTRKVKTFCKGMVRVSEDEFIF